MSEQDFSPEITKSPTSLTRVAANLGFRKLSPTDMAGLEGMEFVKPNPQKDFPNSQNVLLSVNTGDGERHSIGADLTSSYYFWRQTREEVGNSENEIGIKTEADGRILRRNLKPDSYQKLQDLIEIWQKPGERFDILMQKAIEDFHSRHEYTITCLEAIKKEFPDYSEILDRYLEDGTLALYQPTEKRGRHRALQVLASKSNLGIRMGYAKDYLIDGERQFAFGYRDVKPVVPTLTSKGVQMDFHQSDWKFESEDEDKRNRSFDEMIDVLKLLRQNGQF